MNNISLTWINTLLNSLIKTYVKHVLTKKKHLLEI